MQALVTGANGFIGSFLVEELVRRGYQVRCLVLPDEPPGWIEGLPVEICRGDLCRGETLSDAVHNVDYIYHLAGVKTVWDSGVYFRVNVEGTKNLVRAVLKENPGLRRFVYVSSQAAAGPSLNGEPVTEEESYRPVTSYGKSKQAAEEFLKRRAQEIPVTIVRPVLVYGPRNLETRMLFGLARWGVVPVIRNHDQYLNLIYVSDVVDGLILAAEHERAYGQVYFLTDPDAFTWTEIARESFRIMARRGWVLPIPPTGIKLAAGITKSIRRLMGRSPQLIDEKLEEIFHSHWLCSGEKARRELGFEPRVSLSQGVEETIRWYEARR